MPLEAPLLGGLRGPELVLLPRKLVGNCKPVSSNWGPAAAPPLPREATWGRTLPTALDTVHPWIPQRRTTSGLLRNIVGDNVSPQGPSRLAREAAKEVQINQASSHLLLGVQWKCSEPLRRRPATYLSLPTWRLRGRWKNTT